MDNTSDLFSLSGRAYVQGKASGRLIASNVELSFWGGVNQQTGEIIDRHHPLCGQCLGDSILAIPSGRGSCAGSGVMLELLLNKKGPRAILFQRQEDILTLGVVIADEMFGKAIPVVVLSPTDFGQLLEHNGQKVHVENSFVSNHELDDIRTSPMGGNDTHSDPLKNHVRLSEFDKELVNGTHGEAARASIRIILRMADLLEATELMNISQVHVDGCIYTGPGSLKFAEQLRDWGGKVRVPTTLNSISVDQKRWRAQGVDSVFGEAAGKLASAYTDMGAKPTFTCAPYQLESAPKLGDQVAWAESNAVVYANSVLGARTMKYPDFLDIAIALTGRAPKGGPHIDTNRLASIVVRLTHVQGGPTLEDIDDSFFPLLGYHVGALARSQIPVVVGLESLVVSKDDLKAFGAAFATVSGAPMFHIVGITPEASSLDAVTNPTEVLQTEEVDLSELAWCWEKLNSPPTGPSPQIDLVSLGNPHFSFSEIKNLAKVCQGREKDGRVGIIVTCGRSTYALAAQAGFIEQLEEFGVQFVTDTCWCMITEPVIPLSAKVIMTNSGKYAHYGPGLTGRAFYFGSVAGCVDAACSGGVPRKKPHWLSSK